METLASDPKLFEAVVTAIEGSDLTDRQKRVFVRRLKWRPRIRQAVMDEVIASAYAVELILLQEDGVLIDWEGIFELIKVLLPIILQLIGLFG